MPSGLNRAPEQFSAERLIDRVWVEFNRKTLSQGAIYVLWSGFETAEELTHRYFIAKGDRGLLDGRRHLSAEDEERVSGIKELADQVVEYRNWARGESGDLLLRDILVGYCSAFENSLKSVALAFSVAAECQGNISIALMSAERLIQLRREVRKSWSKQAWLNRESSRSTAEAFFAEEILRRNPDPNRWPFKNPRTEDPLYFAKYKVSTKDYWADVAEAFKLRNKIVHQNGYLDEYIEIADRAMHVGEEVQVDVKVVQRVREAFLALLGPLNPEQL